MSYTFEGHSVFKDGRLVLSLHGWRIESMTEESADWDWEIDGVIQPVPRPSLVIRCRETYGDHREGEFLMDLEREQPFFNGWLE